ncbi:hypothetical protein DFJ74DRAFT_666377 [Hyaloraphidium curvatum]|nr:hypothetical protein DFJ74DRAFT_666377 [Hyaloraphidium curvatum]
MPICIFGNAGGSHRRRWRRRASGAPCCCRPTRLSSSVLVQVSVRQDRWSSPGRSRCTETRRLRRHPWRRRTELRCVGYPCSLSDASVSDGSRAAGLWVRESPTRALFRLTAPGSAVRSKIAGVGHPSRLPPTPPTGPNGCPCHEVVGPRRLRTRHDFDGTEKCRRV